MHDPLIRKQLPPGWIDLAVGEAHIIRQALVETCGSFCLDDTAIQCDYQAPEGYPPLVEYLERRYNSSVVITAGAKQGLSAVFYALKRQGIDAVAMRTPYWSQMPAAIEIAGLEVIKSSRPVPRAAYLMVSPNNPDGHVTTVEDARELASACEKLRVPLIHDAAYHHPIYGAFAEGLAGTSIYSSSKMYGLSGLRAGYIVTSNAVIKQAVCEYIEATTVGVSLLSQRVLRRVVEQETNARFIERAQYLLKEAKALAATLHPSVLDATGIERSSGMFGWFKMGPKFNADAAQVHIAPGYAFGDPTRVRLNLAVEPAKLQVAIERLNKLV